MGIAPFALPPSVYLNITAFRKYFKRGILLFLLILGKGGVSTHISGGGGSGYIGNVLLSNKHMYGFEVPTSEDDDTKTSSGTCISAKPTADCAKCGNGYAKITFLGE